MPTARNAADDRTAFDPYLRTGWRSPPLELKFNPNHDPANGRFTSGEGVGSGPLSGLREASLGLYDKTRAKVAFATNYQHIAENIARQVQRIGGRSFTPAELHSILSDVLNGPSTSMAGLMLFSDPNLSRFNAAQRRVIDTYVGELPSTPLNNAVRAGWKSYLARTGAK